MATKSDDEVRLAGLAKRLPATPHKPRDESKIGKPKAVAAKSPAQKAKAVSKRG